MNSLLCGNFKVMVMGVRLCLILLPAHASEQGNIIGLVSVYIYMCVQKKL